MKAIHMTIGIIISLLLIASVTLVLGFSSPSLPSGALPSVTPPAEGVVCTLDAKICPDGSTVGRMPPACEFTACPGEEASRSGQQSDGYQLITTDEGLSGGLEAQRTVTVFNQSDLQALWNEVYASVEPQPPVPSIDFTGNAVVGYFSGLQQNGGYTIKVDSVRKTATTTDVTFLQTQPGEGCMTTSVITKPYILISIPNDGTVINVTVTRETRSCM